MFGSRRERWTSNTEVATCTGIAPVIERSGKRCVVHWRWACLKFVRQSLHEFAASSLLFCDWANTFYQSQRARGKTHHGAVHALSMLEGSLPIRPRQTRRRSVKNFSKIVDGLPQVSHLTEIAMDIGAALAPHRIVKSPTADIILFEGQDTRCLRDRTLEQEGSGSR